MIINESNDTNNSNDVKGSDDIHNVREKAGGELDQQTTSEIIIIRISDSYPLLTHKSRNYDRDNSSLVKIRIAMLLISLNQGHFTEKEYIYFFPPYMANKLLNIITYNRTLY